MAFIPHISSHLGLPHLVRLFLHPLQYGRTPLHLAADAGHVPALQTLLLDLRVNAGERTKVRGHGLPM